MAHSYTRLSSAFAGRKGRRGGRREKKERREKREMVGRNGKNKHVVLSLAFHTCMQAKKCVRVWEQDYKNSIAYLIFKEVFSSYNDVLATIQSHSQTKGWSQNWTWIDTPVSSRDQWGNESLHSTLVVAVCWEL